MYIIPAIDIIDGKCVRLSKGDYNTAKTYDAQPIDMAMQFEDHGIKKLHLVDLDGAKQKKVIHYKIIEQIASKTSLWLDVGGGIQSDEDLRIVFECGAKQATGGSIAVKNPQLFASWLNTYGNERIILGTDIHHGKIAVHGWQEESEIYWQDFLEKYMDKNVKYTISTDVSKDGMLQGPNFDLYREMKERFSSLHIIASGGIHTLKDLDRLNEIGVYGAITGKAIYEGRFTLTELKKWMEHNAS